MAYLPRRLRDQVTRSKERVARYMEPTEYTADRELDPNEKHRVARKTNAPEIEVPWSMRVAAAWSWRLIVIAAVAVLLGLLIYEVRSIVIPAVIAIFVTAMVEPIAVFMRRKLRFPRFLAALVTVVALVGGVGWVIVTAGRSIVSGFGQLSTSAREGFESLLTWLAEGPLQISQDQIDHYMDSLTSAVQDNASTLASGALSVTTSIGNISAGLFLVIFLLLFFLMDGRRMWVWFVRILPSDWRSNIHEGSIRGYYTLKGYMRSTVLVAFIDAVGIGLGALILGLDLWLPIGVLVFLGSFIPIVGALLTGIVAVLVALVELGPVTALIMLGIVLAVQQIEGNVLQPLIMGNSTSLHPAAVVLGVAGGTYVAGITGAVFTVPIMAFLNTFLLYLSGRDKYPKLATAHDRPGGPPGTLDEQIRASYGYQPEQTVRGNEAGADSEDDAKEPVAPDEEPADPEK